MKKRPFTFKYSLQPGFRKIKNLPEELKNKIYPLIPITLYYKGQKTHLIEGLLDSGSDGLFIPKGIAEFLNLPTGIERESEGTGGKIKSFETEVGLKIGRGGREDDFGIVKVVYPDEYQDSPVLIGRKPIFDEYQIIFEEYNKKFKLIPKETLLNSKK